MSEQKTTEYAPEEEMMNALATLVLSIFFIVLSTVHIRFIYQDFFTPERACLNHRRNKPKLSPGYRRMGYITVTCLLFYTLLLICTAMQYNFSYGGCMFGWAIPEKIGFFASKACLYLAFVHRSHEVYGQSAYGYKVGTLKCVAATIIVYSFGNFVFFLVTYALFPWTIDDSDGSYPHYCQNVIQDPWLTFVGGGILMFDLISAGLSIWAFQRPLKKVINAAMQYAEKTQLQDESKKKRFTKMMYTGTKYKVLVWTASITTLTWIVVMMVGFQAVATFLINLDYLVNPVCLLLMTPYYPSNIFYERLCCPCLKCCDPSGKSYSSRGDTNRNESMLNSEASATNSGTGNTDTRNSVDTSRALHTQKSLPQPSEVHHDAVNSYDEAPDVIDDQPTTTV